MPSRLDLTGKKYGRLTGIRPVESKGRGVHWLFGCECGNETVVIGSDVKRGETVSCGCYRGTTKRLYKETTLNQIYKTHCEGARNRGWVPLPRDEWERFRSIACYYCNGYSLRKPHKKIIPRLGETAESVNKSYEIEANGIDRVDNAKGYEHGNMVPCCQMCNQMKMSFNYEQFIEQVRKIYANRASNRTGKP